MLLVFAALAALATAEPQLTKSPHILFMLADDLGYANVGWHNKDVLTPRLDGLVANGLQLERHYVCEYWS